eukprot:403345942
MNAIFQGVKRDNNQVRSQSILQPSGASSNNGPSQLNEAILGSLSDLDKLYFQFIQGSKDSKKLYIAAVEAIPNDAELVQVIIQLSRKLTENAYFTEAKSFIQTCNNDIQNNYELLEEAARIYMIFNEYKNCIEYHKKAIPLKYTAQDENLCNIGLAYHELEDYNEALVHLNQAIQKNPRNLYAKVNQALVYKDMGNYERAQAILQEVIDQDPNEAAAKVNMGNIYQIQSKYEQAAILYLEALEIDLNDEDALCNLGLVLSRIQYNDYAKLAFEEGININPGNKAILKNYLLFLLEIKHFDKFSTIMNHAKRVLDQEELLTYQKLLQDFQKATGSQYSLPGLAVANSNQVQYADQTKKGSLKSSLKNFFSKKKVDNKIKMVESNPIKEIEEEDKDDY